MSWMHWRGQPWHRSTVSGALHSTDCGERVPFDPPGFVFRVDTDGPGPGPVCEVCASDWEASPRRGGMSSTFDRPPRLAPRPLVPDRQGELARAVRLLVLAKPFLRRQAPATFAAVEAFLRGHEA